MRYHSLILKTDNALPIDVIARTLDDKQEVMAFVHRELPLAGVQFHPESVLTPDGMQLLRNWFVHCRLLPS